MLLQAAMTSAAAARSMGRSLLLRFFILGTGVLLCLGLALLPFLLLSLVEAGDAVASEEVDGRIGLLWLVVGLQIGRLLATSVHVDDLLGTLGGDGLEIGGYALVGGVGDESCEDVALEIEIVGILRLEHNLTARQATAVLDIVVDLVVEAALELGAHACKLLWIERDVLETGGGSADADEILHPGGAAELASAGACSSDASSFLSRTYLLHLDAHMEGGSEVLDELAEVDALVGDIVEDGLLTIALILDVANLHLQSEALGYLAALDHGLVLTCLGFAELVHVGLAGEAVDALDIVSRLEVGLLYLEVDEATSERDNADVVTRAGLDGHDVAFLQGEVVDVVVVAFARVLELHLDEVGGLSIARHVGQPVVGVELSVLSSDGSGA